MTSAVAMPEPEPEEGSSEFETLWERRMQALSLRNGGMTFSQIATFQKVSPAQARRDVEWAKRHIAGDDIESIISVQRSVIIDMRRANYQAMLQGDKDASATILKGLDHEAKLLGLYAPVRVTTGPSHVEFSERAAELIKQVSPNTIKELVRGTSVFRHEQEQQRRTDRAAESSDDPIDVDIVADVSPFGPPAEPVGASAQAARDVGPPDAPVAREQPDARPTPPDDDDWSNIG